MLQVRLFPSGKRSVDDKENLKQTTGNPSRLQPVAEA